MYGFTKWYLEGRNFFSFGLLAQYFVVGHLAKQGFGQLVSLIGDFFFYCPKLRSVVLFVLFLSCTGCLHFCSLGCVYFKRSGL